jgi:hypothetical protein
MKKRAIDENMFDTLPIFNDGLDCRLFVFKPQFDISRQLIFGGGGGRILTVGNRRPPEKVQKSHLFFKSDKFWKMPCQSTAKGVKKLSTAEKV